MKFGANKIKIVLAFLLSNINSDSFISFKFCLKTSSHFKNIKIINKAEFQNSALLFLQ